MEYRLWYHTVLLHYFNMQNLPLLDFLLEAFRYHEKHYQCLAEYYEIDVLRRKKLYTCFPLFDMVQELVQLKEEKKAYLQTQKRIPAEEQRDIRG